MKLWIDTEFNEYRGELISLALVAEDGREWYGVRYCDAPGMVGQRACRAEAEPRAAARRNIAWVARRFLMLIR
jgi:hypothetical protein